MFSVFAFEFGGLIGLGLLLHNALYLALSRLFKVRVLKVGFMFPFFGKYLLKTKVRQTVYTLGWIPTGTYVGFFGADEKDLLINTAHDESYTLVRKPLWQQAILKGGGIIGWMLTLLIILFFISKNHSFSDGFWLVLHFIKQAFSTLFGYLHASDLVNQLQQRVADYNKLPFTFAVFISIIILLTPLQFISPGNSRKKYRWIQSFLTIVLLIITGYQYCWKIPSLLMSVLAFSSIMKYTICTLMGIASVCCIGQPLFVFFAKRAKPW